MLLSWLAPPEAFTKSGTLNISISIFDLHDGKLAFSWNTAKLDKLKIGSTVGTVGHNIKLENNVYIPSKNEILVINSESKSIMSPDYYNSTFCNYGDVNTSTIYF
jgi:hypothetical protein